jgi:hypothetical protein
MKESNAEKRESMNISRKETRSQKEADKAEDDTNE